MWLKKLLILVGCACVCTTEGSSRSSSSRRRHRQLVNADYDQDRQHPSSQSPEIDTQPLTVTAVTGDTVYLNCTVKRLGKNSLTWRRGDNSVISVARAGLFHSIVGYVLKDKRITTNITTTDDNANNTDSSINSSSVLNNINTEINNSVLAIDNITEADAGRYTCEIEGRAGNIAVTHTLVVHSPPVLTPQRRTSVYATEGDVEQMTCTAQGTPTPSVSWYKKEARPYDYPHQQQPVTTSLLERDSPVLTLTNVTYRDSGPYVCIAANGVGEPVPAVIMLAVRHAPVVAETQPTVHSDIGLSAVLMCQILAHPLAMVTWHRTENDSPVDPLRLKTSKKKGTNKYALHFPSVLRSDFGQYRCDAANPLGKSSGTAILTAVPGVPDVVSETYSNYTNQYTLQWQVESHAPILHYVLSIKNITDPDDQSLNLTVSGHRSRYSTYHSQKMEFTHLQPDSRYRVNIAAFNEYGSSELAFPFAFQTASDSADDYFDDSSTTEVQATQQEQQQQQQQQDGNDTVSSPAPPAPAPTMGPWLIALALSAFFWSSASSTNTRMKY